MASNFVSATLGFLTATMAMDWINEFRLPVIAAGLAAIACGAWLTWNAARKSAPGLNSWN